MNATPQNVSDSRSLLGHDWLTDKALQLRSIFEGPHICKEKPQKALPGLQRSVVDDVQAVAGLIVAQRCQGVTIAAEAGVYVPALPLWHHRAWVCSHPEESGSLKPRPQ